MNRKLDFKKGDKCIMAIVPRSNVARYFKLKLDNIQEWTYEVEVVIVSSKYITVDFRGDKIKFEIDNDYYEKVSRGGSNYQLFKDMDEIKEKTEKKELFSYLESAFSQSYTKNKIDNFSLDQLRRIKDIVEEE